MRKIHPYDVYFALIENRGTLTGETEIETIEYDGVPFDHHHQVILIGGERFMETTTEPPVTTRLK